MSEAEREWDLIVLQVQMEKSRPTVLLSVPYSSISS